MRGGFRVPGDPEPAAPAPVSRVVPIRPEYATAARPVVGVDWGEVARFRGDVAKRLPGRVGGGVADRAEEEAAGWSVIRQLLEDLTASFRQLGLVSGCLLCADEQALHAVRIGENTAAVCDTCHAQLEEQFSGIVEKNEVQGPSGDPGEESGPRLVQVPDAVDLARSSVIAENLPLWSMRTVRLSLRVTFSSIQLPRSGIILAPCSGRSDSCISTVKSTPGLR